MIHYSKVINGAMRYIDAEIISKITGSDTSAILDVINFGIRDIFEAIEQIVAK